MKTILFYCPHCEAKRKVIIEDSNPTYIFGKCPVCKKLVTINKRSIKIPINLTPN
jgi:phage FluMu protein Com